MLIVAACDTMGVASQVAPEGHDGQGRATALLVPFLGGGRASRRYRWTRHHQAMGHEHAMGDTLTRMVDEGRLDDLLGAVSLTDIGEAWCCYARRQGNDHEDPDWWAVEFWLSDGLAFEREEVARDGLLALVNTAPDDLLGRVGAGPLETFVSNDESRVRWIEEQAAHSDRFRRALANVWTWGTESDDVAARLERAARVRLARPTGWTGSQLCYRDVPIPLASPHGHDDGDDDGNDRRPYNHGDDDPKRVEQEASAEPLDPALLSSAVTRWQHGCGVYRRWSKRARSCPRSDDWLKVKTADWLAVHGPKRIDAER
jgi:hypothetical protein